MTTQWSYAFPTLAWSCITTYHHFGQPQTASDCALLNWNHFTTQFIKPRSSQLCHPQQYTALCEIYQMYSDGVVLSLFFLFVALDHLSQKDDRFVTSGDMLMCAFVVLEVKWKWTHDLPNASRKWFRLLLAELPLMHFPSWCGILDQMPHLLLMFCNSESSGPGTSAHWENQGSRNFN